MAADTPSLPDLLAAFNRGHTGDVLKDGRHYFRFQQELWSTSMLSLASDSPDMSEAEPITAFEMPLTLAEIETVCRELETILYGDESFPTILRKAIETLEYFKAADERDSCGSATTWRKEDEEFLDFLRAQLAKF